MRQLTKKRLNINRDWRRIKELPEQWLCTRNIHLFVMYARTKVWKSWDDFMYGLKDKVRLHSLCEERSDELFLFSCGEEKLRPKIEMEALARWASSIIEAIETKEITEKKLESLRRKCEALWELLKEYDSKVPGYKMVEGYLIIAEDLIHKAEEELKKGHKS